LFCYHKGEGTAGQAFARALTDESSCVLKKEQAIGNSDDLITKVRIENDSKSI
jgi:hypothetical protein